MQPYINFIDNFEAEQNYTVDYTYLGSERILTNEVSIKENKTSGKTVYTRQSTKFDKNHVIPANSLKNGESYLIKLRVKINDSDWSDWSPEIPFVCLSTPTLDFTTLDDKNYIYNNDVMMNVLYRQKQGEKIETFQFSLLDENKVPIYTYPVRFPDPSTPNSIGERMSDLIKGKLYYVGCRIITKNGIVFFDSHEFIPHYVAPSMAGIVDVQNNSEDGQVLVQTFLRQMLGTQTKPFIPGKNGDVVETSYVYLNNEWIVIPETQPLMYKRLGMAKASDWMAKIWCKNVPNGLFIDMTRTNGDPIGLKFYKENDYITCEKEFLGVKSRTRSNIVKDLKLKEFYLYIKVIEYRIQMTITPVN